METKVCKGCGKEQPLADFYRNNMAKDGHDCTCKSCRKKERRQRRQENGTPQPGIKATFRISDFEDTQLFAELRRRGYAGELHFSRVVVV